MNNTARANILVEVHDEREHQDRQWGGPDHDDGHTAEDFHEFIRHQIDRTRTQQEARARFVKIAALAVAAVESIDRKTDGWQTGKPKVRRDYETRIPGATGVLRRHWDGSTWCTNHTTERDTTVRMKSSYQDYEWRAPQ